MNDVLEAPSEIEDLENAPVTNAQNEDGIHLKGAPAAVLYVCTIMAAAYNRVDVLSTVLKHADPLDINAPYGDTLREQIVAVCAPLNARVDASDIDTSNVKKVVASNLPQETAQWRDSVDGDTALHLAVRLNCDDAAAALLKSGADPDIRNSEGETPIDLANRAGPSHALVCKLLNGVVRMENSWGNVKVNAWAEGWLKSGNRRERLPKRIVVHAGPNG